MSYIRLGVTRCAATTGLTLLSGDKSFSGAFYRPRENGFIVVFVTIGIFFSIFITFSHAFLMQWVALVGKICFDS